MAHHAQQTVLATRAQGLISAEAAADKGLRAHRKGKAMNIRTLILLCLLAIAAPLGACESAPSEMVDLYHNWIANDLRTFYQRVGRLPGDLTLAQAGVNPDDLDNGAGPGANFGMIVESSEPPVVTLVYRHLADEQSRNRFMRVDLRSVESRVGWLPEGDVAGHFDWEPDRSQIAQRNFRHWVYVNDGLFIGCVFLALFTLVGAAGLRITGQSTYSALERRWVRLHIAALAWITSLCMLSLLGVKRGLEIPATILTLGSVIAFGVLVFTAVRLKPRTFTLLWFQAAPWVVVATIAMNWTMMTISCGGRPELGWALFWLVVGAIVSAVRFVSARIE